MQARTKRVLSVVRRSHGLPGFELFAEGDLILSIGGKPVSRVRDLYGVTPQGELIQIDHRSGRAQVVSRVRATFYGACAMLRI